MKKLYQYTMILMAGVLGACSSMSVSDPYSDSFPADFDVNVYSALHPELRMIQITDYVAKRNSETKAAWTAQGIDAATISAATANDEAAFAADAATLQTIYTNYYMGTDWATDATSPTVLAALNAYNFIESTNDLALLNEVPINNLLISEQYIMFGMSHGWAYRVCTDAEAADDVNHPNRATLPIKALQDSTARAATVPEAKNFVADTHLYCRDANGIDRLIQ